MQVSPPYTDCDSLGQHPQLHQSSGTVLGWMCGCGHHLLESDTFSETQNYSGLSRVFRNVQDYFLICVSFGKKNAHEWQKDSEERVKNG